MDKKTETPMGIGDRITRFECETEKADAVMKALDALSAEEASDFLISVFPEALTVAAEETADIWMENTGMMTFQTDEDMELWKKAMGRAIRDRIAKAMVRFGRPLAEATLSQDIRIESLQDALDYMKRYDLMGTKDTAVLAFNRERKLVCGVGADWKDTLSSVFMMMRREMPDLVDSVIIFTKQPKDGKVPGLMRRKRLCGTIRKLFAENGGWDLRDIFMMTDDGPVSLTA